MPANFTEEQRQEIRKKLISVGYDMIREIGLKKMKVSMIANRVDIATGTFYHFFASKEAYVEALIMKQDLKMQAEEKYCRNIYGKGGIYLFECIFTV